MRIAFISNYLNHHQLPFCIAMNKKPNIDYFFIATQEIPPERIKLGYDNMNTKYDFVIETYKSKKKEEEALEIINASDVVIIGSAPEKYIQKRLMENKLTFRYSERIFKRGIWRMSNIPTMLSMIKRHTVHRKKQLYMLCASAYTAKDFALVGAYKNKSYKWGYFPETKQYEIEKLIESKEQNSVIKLLWVARFIDWKHPELVVELAKELKKDNYNFKIEMIGCGDMLDQIIESVKQYNLNDVIEIIGAVKATQVRNYMEKANVFLVTSDQNEGWGAVVNEAMNSGCVVIGNKNVGAIPYLIKEGKNGLSYSNKQEFFKKVKYIIDNKEERKKIAKEAYTTIERDWNAENASDKFIRLCESIINKKEIEITDGPCSEG